MSASADAVAPVAADVRDLIADKRVHVMDGAMGTLLHTRGIAFDQCFDELNLTQPATVAEIHRAYIDAGAQLIITNTFGANRYKLSEHALDKCVAEINLAPAAKARLMEMGLLNGTAIELVRFAPMGDPVEIKVRGYNLSLRKNEAEQILVRPKS